MIKFHHYYRVSLDGVTRFETLFLEQAEEFARHLYKSEKRVSDIDEVSR
jgi:hypothetical protein